MESFFSFVLLGVALALAWLLRRQWLPKLAPLRVRRWVALRSSVQLRFVQPIDPPEQAT